MAAGSTEVFSEDLETCAHREHARPGLDAATETARPAECHRRSCLRDVLAATENIDVAVLGTGAPIRTGTSWLRIPRH